MNSLVKKLKVVAVVLLVSSIFVSCENPGKIGLNINPKNSTLVTKYKEFILPSTQVQFNPRSTSNSASLQAGSYSSPDFGILTSKSYTWLRVQRSTPVLSASATYVDIKFSIQFSSVYGSKTVDDEIQSFELYQLAGDIEPDKAYTRVDDIALGSLIGTLNLYLQENDTLRMDSLFSINLSDAFGKKIFDKLKANDGTFDDETVFNAFIKGLAIVPSTTNTKIVQFNPATFNIKVNYTEVNSAGETVDRTYALGLSNKRFYHLSSDLSGTSLSGILPNNKDFTPSDEYRYLQSGTMIAIKVNYDSVFTFFDEYINNDSSGAIIQKALLTMGDLDLNPPGVQIPFSLIGYFTDETNVWPGLAQVSNDSVNIFATLQQEFTTFKTPSFPGYYGNTQNIITSQFNPLKYEATMSNFLQHLIDGGYNTSNTPLEQSGNLILFVPSSETFPESSPSHIFTNYFKVHKDSIKLKIYYAIPNF